MAAKTNYIKFVFITALLLVGHLVCAQNPSFSALEFKTKDDFQKHEAKIKEMAEYILANPVDDSPTRKIAMMNIIKWMTGTPDHNFIVDGSIMDLAKNNDEVLPLYMASATKASLDVRGKDAQQLKLDAFELLLSYCSSKANGVKANKEMKKALSARESGRLKEYLSI
jgi:hypothetical protein